MTQSIQLTSNNPIPLNLNESNSKIGGAREEAPILGQANPKMSGSPTREEPTVESRAVCTIQSPSLEKRGSSILTMGAKFLLTISVIAGIAAATFFSGGAALAMIGAHAALWKIGFISIAAITSLITFLGSLFYSIQENMFVETDDNIGDSIKYLAKTFSTAITVASTGISFFKDCMIWEMIFSKD